MKWEREALGQICSTSSGGTPNRKNKTFYVNGVIPWVKSGELRNNTIYFSEELITEEALKNSSAKVFPKGTLLIAMYGATIGKLAFLGIDAATNQAVCGIFKNPKVLLKYLYFYLLFQRPNLIKRGIGDAQPNISQTILKQLNVSYPAEIREQERIVARIEELFSELDKAVETLNTTKQQLAVYRQAVLKEAFDVTSDVMPLGEYIDSIEGGKSFKCIEVPPQIGECGIVKVSSVTWGEFNENESKTCDRNKFLPEKRILPGDFLFSRANTLQLVGNCVIVKHISKELMLSDKVLRIKFAQQLLPQYALYFLRSKNGRQQIERLSTGNQESMRNIGQDRIRKILIPALDLCEQQRIVRAIEGRLSICDQIEKIIEQSLQQAEALRQSILKQAFEGRL